MKDSIQLPKVNERKLQSKQMQTKLELKIKESINELEKEFSYEFLPYEVDNVLLGIVKTNHTSYLNQALGFDTIS